MNDSLKKLATVVFFTGLGHLLSAFLYPIASRYASSEDIVSIGLFDSTIMMLMALLGFGLNATATRDIALTAEWKSILNNVQSARISIALLCFIVGVLYIGFDFGQIEIGLVLLAAPIWAINYDFALYGLGKPTSASIASFIRQSPPLFLFIILLIIGFESPFIYFMLSVVFIFVAAVMVSKFANAKLFYKPSLKFYLPYKSAAWVGIAGLFIAFQRFGFLSYIEGRIPQTDFVFLATSLKLLLLVVASKRIIIQVFYTKLIDDSLCKKLNLLAFSMSLIILAVTYGLSETLSVILFNSEKAESYVLLIALGTCALLFFAVSDSKLLLQRQDKWMSTSTVIGGGLFMVCIFMGKEYIPKGEHYLFLLILTELLLAILYRLGIAMHIRSRSIYD